MNLYVIGTGPGSSRYIAPRAIEALESVDCVAGYTTYIQLIQDLISGKEIISTGMMKEVDRVAQAIDQVRSGRSCALISGGDPGIYAMAGLVFELCEKRGIPLKRNPCEAPGEGAVALEVIPGIPALSAGAALAGAPLTHDFAAISLSDLLTPWETIEKRLSGAAMADFVMVLYNPKSKKRDWQLGRAQELILAHRSPRTPVAVVTGAMRDNQAIQFTTLEKLVQADVDMQTVIFIGNESSRQYIDFMYTARGYTDKYQN